MACCSAAETEELAAENAKLWELVERVRMDLVMFMGAGVSDPSCPQWAEELLDAIEALDAAE